VTVADARHDWQRMCADPISATRPIVVVGGYGDPGLAVLDVATRLRRVLGPQAQVIPVEVGLTWSMDDARDRVVRAVEKFQPSEVADRTIQVDVVAISMGGLVARHAAADHEGFRRLSIARLFTVSSPHSGARLANLPSLESRVRDMRKGSDFLSHLEGNVRDFDLIPYARLGDWIVGAENTAPAGMTPWWVDTPAFEASHLQAHTDARILADIARRLRGEEPFTHNPAAPLPSGL
jgi:hypothetical protein